MKLVVRTSRISNGLFRATCPALPGCVVFGRSVGEVKARIGQAVCGYLASLNAVVPAKPSRLFSFEMSLPSDGPAATSQSPDGGGVTKVD